MTYKVPGTIKFFLNVEKSKIVVDRKVGTIIAMIFNNIKSCFMIYNQTKEIM